MNFSILIPIIMDVAGNIAKTKLGLKTIKETKNFELDIPCYLVSSEFTLIEDLLKFINVTKRNTNVFSNIELEGDDYVEAAIILPYKIKETKTKNNNSEVIIRQRKEGDTQIMFKSSSLKNLFIELDLFFN